MRVTRWTGFHGPEIRALVERAWTSDDEILVLCPPGLENFAGFRHLDGEWSAQEKPVLGLFTTGTSRGEARLVIYSKACIRASLAGILSFFDVSRIYSIFCYPQPFHTFGLLLGYILALEKNWPLTAPEGKYGSHFHTARRELTTDGLLTLGTPTHFQDLMAQNFSLTPSYACIVGGAGVSRTLWHRLRDELHIQNPSIGYGNTEASPGIAHLPAGQAPLEDFEIGYPLPGLKLHIDSGRGYEFSGPSLCLAIVHSDGGIEFPQKMFIADELRRRSDGVYIFDGRNDLVLNRGGEKFSLEAIERCLRRELNLESVALALSHARLGYDLGLWIRGPFESARVLHALNKEFRVIFEASNFQSVEHFPVNAHQKLDRRAAALGL